MTSICIFGFGPAGKALNVAIARYNSSIRVCFCDNNSQTHYNADYEIFAPAQLPERFRGLDALYIPYLCTFGQHNMEMIEQLYNLDVDMGNVYIVDVSRLKCGESFHECLLKCAKKWLTCGFSDELPLTISYPEISKRKLLLLGKEKIINDVIDYFSELHIQKADSVSGNQLESELQIICDFDKGQYLTQINVLGLAHGVDYIWIEDLIGALRESETYYTSVYHNGKPVVVMGSSIWVRMIVDCNPNMNIHSIVETDDLCQFTAPTSPGALFIIAASDCISAKTAMQNAGFIFGEDFYIYDVNNTKLAQMLKETISSEKLMFLNCTPNLQAAVTRNGYIHHCCNKLNISPGSILHNSCKNILVSPIMRAVYLSCANKTYVFCKENCLLSYSNEQTERSSFSMPSIKDYVLTPGYIHACNIYCRSCREEIFSNENDTDAKTTAIHNEFLDAMPELKGISNPSGELLFSKMMRQLLEADTSRELTFTTNGTLMNQKNWDYLLSLYDDVSVLFSIDGAVKETFEYLRRGASFEVVMKNLQLAANLRAEGKIRDLSIRCVVQKDNFRELEKVAELGISVDADNVFFNPVDPNNGAWTTEIHSDLNVYDPANPLYNEFLKKIATNPILQKPPVFFFGMDKLQEALSGLHLV